MADAPEQSYDNLGLEGATSPYGLGGIAAAPKPTPTAAPPKPVVVPDTGTGQFKSSTAAPGSDKSAVQGNGQTLPPPPGLTSRTAAAGTHKIDAAAMRSFASGLDNVAVAVRSAQSMLEGAMAPAGGFAPGYKLTASVLGAQSGTADLTLSGSSSATVPSTWQFLARGYDAIRMLQDHTTQAAKLFEDADSFSADQAKRLTTVVAGAGSDVAYATGSTTSSSTGGSTTGTGTTSTGTGTGTGAGTGAGTGTGTGTGTV